MTRIVLEKIENIEKEMKIKLEDSQKLNIELKILIKNI